MCRQAMPLTDEAQGEGHLCLDQANSQRQQLLLLRHGLLDGDRPSDGLRAPRPYPANGCKCAMTAGLSSTDALNFVIHPWQTPDGCSAAEPSCFMAEFTRAHTRKSVDLSFTVRVRPLSWRPLTSFSSDAAISSDHATQHSIRVATCETPAGSENQAVFR